MLLGSTVIGFGPAHAADQALDCGIGGKQQMNLVAVMPAKSSVGAIFHLQIGGDETKPAKAAGSDIKNLEWYIQLPSGMTASNPAIQNVGKQGTIISGSGTLGTSSRMTKALLTWATPAAFAIGLWDGIVSTLREYTVDELYAMVKPLGTPFRWGHGTYEFWPLGRYRYFLGVPRDRDTLAV